MLIKRQQSGRFVVRAFVALRRQLRKRAGMVGGHLAGGSLRGNPASLTHHCFCLVNLNRLFVPKAITV